MGKRLQRLLGRLLVAALWVGAGYYFVFGGEYTYLDRRALEEERDAVAARVDSLDAVADSLRRRGDRLESDPMAIERVARERYGFVREGELLYRFVEVRDGGERAAREAGDEGGTTVDRSGKRQ